MIDTLHIWEFMNTNSSNFLKTIILDDNDTNSYLLLMVEQSCSFLFTKNYLRKLQISPVFQNRNILIVLSHKKLNIDTFDAAIS